MSKLFKNILMIFLTFIMIGCVYLTMNMTSSNFEGIINSDNTAKNIKLVIDSSSKIKLLGDSYITSIDGDTSNIDFNVYKLYVNGKAI